MTAEQNGKPGVGADRGPTAQSPADRAPAALSLVPKTDVPQTKKDFTSDQEVRWCPGCGDYAVLATMQAFLPELGLRRENVVFISGIGCSSRFPYYMNTYGLHSIHGRAPAIATGLSTSRPDLSVWVITGDGDGLSIGGNHLIHALRRNVNLKILLFNNRIYGLTKGQYSPTSELGKITKSTPMGSLDRPFNPLSLALGADATFVARAIDSERKQLTEVLRAAAAHKGAAFVEIYQNCNIYNDGAFEILKGSETRDEVILRLEHGQPMRLGADGHSGVIRRADGSLAVADVADVGEAALLVHDAHADDPSTAFALSRIGGGSLSPTPVGVFRDVQAPVYDDLMGDQLTSAAAAAARLLDSHARLDEHDNGAGPPREQDPLAALLAGSDTWVVA